MALLVKDAGVDALMEELRRLTGGRTTKTAIVRRALQGEVDRMKASLPVAQRLATAKRMMAALGQGSGTAHKDGDV